MGLSPGDWYRFTVPELRRILREGGVEVSQADTRLKEDTVRLCQKKFPHPSQLRKLLTIYGKFEEGDEGELEGAWPAHLAPSSNEGRGAGSRSRASVPAEVGRRRRSDSPPSPLDPRLDSLSASRLARQQLQKKRASSREKRKTVGGSGGRYGMVDSSMSPRNMTFSPAASIEDSHPTSPEDTPAMTPVRSRQSMPAERVSSPHKSPSSTSPNDFRRTPYPVPPRASTPGCGPLLDPSGREVVFRMLDTPIEPPKPEELRKRRSMGRRSVGEDEPQRVETPRVETPRMSRRGKSPGSRKKAKLKPAKSRASDVPMCTILLGFVLVAAAMFYIYHMHSLGYRLKGLALRRPFCSHDVEDNFNCEPCPFSAVCRGFTATCSEVHHRLQKRGGIYVCLPDEARSRATHSYLTTLAIHLSKQEGLRECGLLPLMPAGGLPIRGMKRHEIEDFLRSYDPTSSHDEFVARMSLLWGTSMLGDDEMLRALGLEKTSSDRLASFVARKPWDCRAMEFFWRNVVLLSVVLVVALPSALWYRRWRSGVRAIEDLRGLIAANTRIAQNGALRGYAVGLTAEELLDLLQRDRSRYESTLSVVGNSEEGVSRRCEEMTRSDAAIVRSCVSLDMAPFYYSKKVVDAIRRSGHIAGSRFDDVSDGGMGVGRETHAEDQRGVYDYDYRGDPLGRDAGGWGGVSTIPI